MGRRVGSKDKGWRNLGGGRPRDELKHKETDPNNLITPEGAKKLVQEAAQDKDLKWQPGFGAVSNNFKKLLSRTVRIKGTVEFEFSAEDALQEYWKAIAVYAPELSILATVASLDSLAMDMVYRVQEIAWANQRRRAGMDIENIPPEPEE